MKRAELSEFAVEEEGFKLKIRRGAASTAIPSLPQGSAAPFIVAADPGPAQPASAAVNAPAGSTETTEEAGVTYIKSPMVGTFYRAPSPESASFADTGTKVTETSVVCIVEAMKIMNEIQAEVKGTIVEVLIENGEAVEYGQRLFKVKTA